MAVQTTNNKPLNPRGNDQSPKGYNRASLFSGKALDFDGVNDILTMPTALTSSLSTTSVTFVTYVKSDFSSWTGDRDDAFSFSERGVILAFNNGSIYYYYRHQSASWRNLQVPNANFKPQEWNQMVTTIDLNADTWKAYINGIEVASSGTYSDTAIAYDSNALTIGAQSGARFFDGQIAGFKIFNTALTAAQVADLYNNPEKIVPTGVADSALKLWLPMQEGAGTTAYDGSGNGNHGAVSGASWLHGIGAPVSQTAVIDWNKGTNILENTNIFDGYWTKSGGTLTTGIEAPDGTNTAFKFERDNASSGTIYRVAPAGLSSTNYRYVYAKLPSGSASASAQLLSHNTNTNNTFTITDEWQRFELNSAPNTAPTNFYIVDFRAGVGVDEIHLWAPQAAAGTNESVFVPTIGTAQSSEVLLPQGLTTGRDITGVNLFENVRKQGALNLDGNSWAEVHDNASLDITNAITLEAWLKWDGSLGGIIAKDKASARAYNVLIATGGRISFLINGNTRGTQASALTLNSWTHVLVTYDQVNAKVFIDGVEASSSLYADAIITTADVVEIGRYFGDSVYALSFPIAQPRIYNRALTAEEVQRNYNAGKNIYK